MIHLIHGFNVRDNGKDTVGRLRPYLPGAEMMASYGWVGLLGLRCRNATVVATLARLVNDGDVIVAHSNGCLIAWQLARRVNLGAVVCINPALRRDTLWPPGMPVLCLYNSKDWVVQLGRVWGRLASLGGLYPHGWGAAGRYGFTAEQDRVESWDTSLYCWPHRLKGHSDLFRGGDTTAWWGNIIARWINRVT